MNNTCKKLLLGLSFVYLSITSVLFGALAAVNQEGCLSMNVIYQNPNATINYYDEDGSTKLYTTIARKGNNALSTREPLKDSINNKFYSFDKWVTEKGGTEEADLTNIKSDMNVYASYRELTNKITFSKISAGYLHSMALSTAGDLYTWGWNGKGQLGDNTTDNKHVPTLITVPGVKFTDISAGNYHSMALSTAGDLYTWGLNDAGQLGDNTKVEKHVPTLITVPGVKFTDISAGNDYSMALSTAGDLYTWGDNSNGQLGDNTTNGKNVPTLITVPGVKFTDIATGYAHSMALSTAGDLYTWGWNANGQLGDNTNVDKHVPTLITVPGVKFSDIGAGSHHSMALSIAGDLYTWGWNGNGQLGDNTTNGKKVPTLITVPGVKFTDISAGNDYSMALSTAGDLYTWGDNSNGQLGDGSTNGRLIPVIVICYLL